VISPVRVDGKILKDPKTSPLSLVAENMTCCPAAIPPQPGPQSTSSVLTASTVSIEDASTLDGNQDNPENAPNSVVWIIKAAAITDTVLIMLLFFEKGLQRE
jgi:hypothetical protein